MADIDALRVLAHVNRSFRAAARCRLRPLEHFSLSSAELPYEVHHDKTAWRLYELSGPGVRFRADTQHFGWGSQGVKWHNYQGEFTPMSEDESDVQPGDWEYEYYDLDGRDYIMPEDGRISRWDDIDEATRESARQARVLDVAYPLEKEELFVNSQLMPYVQTVRFVPGEKIETLEYLHPPAHRVVYFDSPARWVAPPVHDRVRWSGRDENENFAFCSDETRKLVVHHRHRSPTARERMFPLTPRRPAQLEELVYVFPSFDAEGAGDAEYAKSIVTFTKLVVWAAGHDIRVTIVGAQDLLPFFLAPGWERHKAQHNVQVSGSDPCSDVNAEVIERLRLKIVQRFKQMIINCAADLGAHPVPGMPTQDLAEKVQTASFVTRDEYRESVGPEDYAIETDIDYYTRQEPLL